jgi:hypothetical protein
VHPIAEVGLFPSRWEVGGGGIDAVVLIFVSHWSMFQQHSVCKGSDRVSQYVVNDTAVNDRDT